MIALLKSAGSDSNDALAVAAAGAIANLAYDHLENRKCFISADIVEPLRAVDAVTPGGPARIALSNLEHSPSDGRTSIHYNLIDGTSRNLDELDALERLEDTLTDACDRRTYLDKDYSSIVPTPRGARP